MKTVSQNTPTIYSATPHSTVGDPGAPCLRLDGPSVRRLLRWYLESVHPEQRRGIYGPRTG